MKAIQFSGGGRQGQRSSVQPVDQHETLPIGQPDRSQGLLQIYQGPATDTRKECRNSGSVEASGGFNKQLKSR